MVAPHATVGLLRNAVQTQRAAYRDVRFDLEQRQQALTRLNATVSTVDPLRTSLASSSEESEVTSARHPFSSQLGGARPLPRQLTSAATRGDDSTAVDIVHRSCGL